MIHCFLVSLEYTWIHADNNVFRKKILIVAVYINNILLCELNKNKILDLKTKLSNHFKMTDYRVCKHYLEMLITQNRALQTLILSQRIYLMKVLKDFDLQNVKVIEFLMYVMTQMQLNITYTVSTLSQFAHNSNNTHWKTLKQVFQYVQRTLDVILEYKFRLSAQVTYRSCKSGLSSGIRSGQTNFYSAKLSVS